jgi:hypothetical protein
MAAHPGVVISFANETYPAGRDGEEIGRATRLDVLLSGLEAWAPTQ